MESHRQQQQSCKITTQVVEDRAQSRYEGWKWLRWYKEVPYATPPLELKSDEGVSCVNREKQNEHHWSQEVVKTLK